MQRLLEIARPKQRATLNLDVEQLLAIVNVTENLGIMAKRYHPEGSVGKVDVFYCTLLHSVERDKTRWIVVILCAGRISQKTKLNFVNAKAIMLICPFQLSWKASRRD